MLMSGAIKCRALMSVALQRSCLLFVQSSVYVATHNVVTGCGQAPSQYFRAPLSTNKLEETPQGDMMMTRQMVLRLVQRHCIASHEALQLWWARDAQQRCSCTLERCNRSNVMEIKTRVRVLESAARHRKRPHAGPCRECVAHQTGNICQDGADRGKVEKGKLTSHMRSAKLPAHSIPRSSEHPRRHTHPLCSHFVNNTYREYCCRVPGVSAALHAHYRRAAFSDGHRILPLLA